MAKGENFLNTFSLNKTRSRLA